MSTNNGKKTMQPGVKQSAGPSFTAAPTGLDQLSQIIKKTPLDILYFPYTLFYSWFFMHHRGLLRGIFQLFVSYGYKIIN